VKAASPIELRGGLTHFVTTRWSLIRNQGIPGSSGRASSELGELCQIYWRPIFTFIFRRGYSAPDAQDLTQDFFLSILEGNLLKVADPGRGRFRSLLLASVKNFLIDAAAKRQRNKRGGGVQFVSWETWMADAPSQLSMPTAAMESAPPEALFDVGWAATIAEEALRRLQMECDSKGRRRVYEVLHRYLTLERSDICYEDLSHALGVPEPSVKSLLHHFRKRYRSLLREEIAKIVEDEANVDDEIRYLCATLSASAS